MHQAWIRRAKRLDGGARLLGVLLGSRRLAVLAALGLLAALLALGGPLCGGGGGLGAGVGLAALG